MVSWQALALNGVLRMTLKRQGNKPFKLEGVREPPRFGLKVPAGFAVEELRTEGNLNFEVASALGSAMVAPVVVLYLHGGGYILCSAKTHRQALLAMARTFEARVFGLDYRLAPEHPFPAAVEDAANACQWLRSAYPHSALVLAGDSAGGGLAIATAIGLRDRGLPQAAAIIGFSPYTDLAVTGESVEANARSCAMLTPRGVRMAAELYLAGADARDPRASPLYADLSNLPPMLLFVSRQEILRDDTLRLAQRARQAGVDVQLVIREGLAHAWPIFVPLIPEAREAYATVASFGRRLALIRTDA